MCVREWKAALGGVEQTERRERERDVKDFETKFVYVRVLSLFPLIWHSTLVCIAYKGLDQMNGSVPERRRQNKQNESMGKQCFKKETSIKLKAKQYWWGRNIHWFVTICAPSQNWNTHLSAGKRMRKFYWLRILWYWMKMKNKKFVWKQFKITFREITEKKIFFFWEKCWLT